MKHEYLSEMLCSLFPAAENCDKLVLLPCSVGWKWIDVKMMKFLNIWWYFRPVLPYFAQALLLFLHMHCFHGLKNVQLILPCIPNACHMWTKRRAKVASLLWKSPESPFHKSAFLPGHLHYQDACNHSDAEIALALLSFTLICSYKL